MFEDGILKRTSEGKWWTIEDNTEETEEE